jgi:hypothetical protein
MRTGLLRHVRLALCLPLLSALAAAEAQAIEMFTFFGDGSRIGLPSLEVPVEAYPGIPLRSDRLRARRRAMRAGPAATVPVGPPGYARGVTIRAMPPVVGESAPTALAPAPRHPAPAVAPEPEDLLPADPGP